MTQSTSDPGVEGGFPVGADSLSTGGIAGGHTWMSVTWAAEGRGCELSCLPAASQPLLGQGSPRSTKEAEQKGGVTETQPYGNHWVGQPGTV